MYAARARRMSTLCQAGNCKGVRVGCLDVFTYISIGTHIQRGFLSSL